MNPHSDNNKSWSAAGDIALVWMAAAGLLHGLIRFLCCSRDLGMQEFFVWGSFVMLSIPVLSFFAGVFYKSGKVSLIIFLIGGVLAFLSIHLFQ